MSSFSVIKQIYNSKKYILYLKLAIRTSFENNWQSKKPLIIIKKVLIIKHVIVAYMY